MEERKVEKFVLVNDLRRLTLRLFNYYTADPRLLFLEHSLPYPADFLPQTTPTLSSRINN